MKALLGLSLILNLVLGYFLFMREPEKKIIERTIIETHEKRVPVKVPQVDTRKVVQPEVSSEAKTPPQAMMVDESVFQEAGERTENDRLEFMTQKLGMSEEKIKEHDRIRDEFFKQSAIMFQKHPFGEMSFRERRQLIDMEERTHKKLEQLHGKKNWERYQKFRESYNKKAMKRQSEEMMPTMFMGL